MSPWHWQNGRHSDGYWLSIHVVNCAVVPDPSDRTTGMILVSGSLNPLLSAVISGSSQLVILPVKIFDDRLPRQPKAAVQLTADLEVVHERRPPATTGM